MKKLGLMTGVSLMFGLASAADANLLYFQMNPNFTAGPRQAFIFGAPNLTGTVANSSGTFSQGFDLGAQGFAVVNVNISDELLNGIVENKGYSITSSGALSGYFLSRAPFTTDMTYLIDSAKLGTNYVVAAYQGQNGAGQVSVQATQNNTSVTISPVGSAPINLTLNAGQTYQYSVSSGDVTGSRVTSSAPVAVFSGNRCANIPTTALACDHIVEQMPSVDLLSTNYLVSQTPRSGPLGNILRVVATQDDTEVSVNGVVVATLDAGQFYEGRVVGGSQISASAKVLVAEYLIGQTEAGANTDPAITIIPGVDQWLSSYVFATPSGIADFPTDFIEVILSNSDTDSLFINGVLANPGLFSAIGSTGYSYANFDVSGTTGPFSITADNPFQLLLSGHDSADSYFTYGGAAFSPGASPPPPNGAIPEPATWAMMIGGFGLVGGVLRRRRRVRVAFA